jgi:hypothetical protein
MLLFSALPSADVNLVDATSERDPVVWNATLIMCLEVTEVTFLGCVWGQ